MNVSAPLLITAFGALAVLGLCLLALQRRAQSVTARAARPEVLDTVAAWPPEGARVLTVSERQAYELLRRAMPGFMVLAQVPLSRFVRVPIHNAYGDWLQRVGQLSADLVLCDGGSRVLAVVDIRSPAETERSRRRHERLARVLRAAGIKVLIWREGNLPVAGEVRSTLTAALSSPGVALDAPESSRPMPLIPVPEIEEILADGDAMDHSMEPVPSGFFDDLEPSPHITRH
ncbi:MAG: DUF2726 domain-containing protein [Rubrivivax sp.]|nr:DUF2726 domain-containing protein [Rubrivivax sp.]